MSLNSNPVIRDVVNYINSTRQKYAIKIHQNGIELYSLNTFHTLSNNQYANCIYSFNFRNYNYPPLPPKKFPEVAQNIHAGLFYRNSVCVRPLYAYGIKDSDRRYEQGLRYDDILGYSLTKPGFFQGIPMKSTLIPLI